MSASVQACLENSAIAERTYRFGPEVLVHAKGHLLRHAIDVVFSKMSIEPVASLSKNDLVFDLRRIERGRLRLFANGLPIVSLQEELELVPVLEGTLIGCAVRKRTECAALHAGSVEIGGSGVLLAGSKGSGKSTLSLSLANEGARYFGDEVAFVRYDDAQLEAFPKAATLKEGSFPFFTEATTTYHDPVRGRVRYHRPKTAVAAGQRAGIDMVVFPCWSMDHQGAAAVTEIGGAEAAMELIRSSFGGLERDRRMLSLVRRLAQVPAYRIQYGDARAAHDAIRTLLASSRKRVVSCVSPASFDPSSPI